MNPLRVCLFLLLAIASSSGCKWHNEFRKTTFPRGVYVSVRGRDSYTAKRELQSYSYGKNDQWAHVYLGPLIVQVEKPCRPKTSATIVYSRMIYGMYSKNPPQPTSKLVKLDYQLGKSVNVYSKTVWNLWAKKFDLDKFVAELACHNITVQDKWFYIVAKNRFSMEFRLQEMTGYLSKNKSRCPPDDSDIEKLCTSKSNYSCPNMTFKEENGISVRNVSMYIVTGEPITGNNCSMNSARYIQYMDNHHYFMGKNSHSKTLKRTIPVMTKAIRVSKGNGPCPKKYQMQFYVNTKHLNERDLPCPTKAGVMLQKVEHMTIYVKTLNGNPDTDMKQAKDQFIDELNQMGNTYIKGTHYISQYRGHGPKFGRTMEIWIEKTEPRYVTICQGGGGNNGSSVRTTSSFTGTSTTTTPMMMTSTTDSMDIPIS